MRIGGLSQRITFLRKTLESNSAGEMVEVWEPWRTVWASVHPVRAREYTEAEQQHPDIEGTIRIRYMDGVKPEMRIRWRERVLQIVGHPKDLYSRQRTIEIMYKESV